MQINAYFGVFGLLFLNSINICRKFGSETVFKPLLNREILNF